MNWGANSSKGSTQKATLRTAALAARAAVADGPARSAAIAVRLRALPAFQAAATICWYVGVRDEVATLPMITAAVAEGRRSAVPWRAGDRLDLFEISGADDLAAASFGLLEPSAAVRSDPSRHVNPEEVDLFVVPGVAFDRRGGRLGYGRGYYDRLLALARPGVTIVGLAFEAQMVELVPAAAHDVPMDAVVTEAAVYVPDA